MVEASRKIKAEVLEDSARCNTRGTLITAQNSSLNKYDFHRSKKMMPVYKYLRCKIQWKRCPQTVSCFPTNCAALFGAYSYLITEVRTIGIPSMMRMTMMIHNHSLYYY